MPRSSLSLGAALLAVWLVALAAQVGPALAQEIPPVEIPGLSPGSPGPGQVPQGLEERPGPPPERCNPRAPFAPGRSGSPTFRCDFPDPMILRVGSSYYAYGTSTGWDHGGEDFPILRSNDLRFWRPWNNAMSSEPAWSAGQLWAPSVLAAHGRYFLYYSARRRSDGVHCLAVATARGPGGPFRDRGPMTCGDRSARGYIDPAALMHRGRGYLFFSVDGPRHSISALRLSPSLLRVRGARRVLVGTTAAWQRGLTTQTVEAPWPVWRDGRFYLLYSAGCWCSDYRMGYAVSRRPLGPYRGVGANPLLRGAPGLVAPGGGSLFRGRGGGSFLAFHAWSGPPDYDLGGTRTLRVAPVSWPGGAPRPLLGR